VCSAAESTLRTILTPVSCGAAATTTSRSSRWATTSPRRSSPAMAPADVGQAVIYAYENGLIGPGES
jgi:hypothetical protein